MTKAIHHPFRLLSLAFAAILLSWAPLARAQLTITYAPQSATNTVGDNVEFAARAANGSDTITYQWTNSAGTVVGTSQNLVLLNVTAGNADTYTVVMTDATTSETLTASATLTVNTSFNPTAGLVMWLPFNDGQSNPSAQTAADASGNNNSGTLQNFENDGNEWVAGPAGGSPGGNALFFANTNGLSNNVVTVNDAQNLNFSNNLAFSFSLWVAGETWTTFNGSLVDSPFTGQISGANVLNKGYGNGGEEYELDTYTSGDYRFYVRNSAGAVSTVQTTAPINNSGVWQHVVCTFDGNAGVTKMAVYVNGVLSSSGTAPTSLLYSSQTLNIGNRQSSSTTTYNEPLIGDISDARMYNYALSASDVQALYNSYNPAGPTVFSVPNATQPIFAGGTLPLYPFETGVSAMTFGWTFSGTNTLSNPTSTACTVNNIAAGNNGTATLTVTNAQGNTTKTVTVTGIAPYTYAAQVMALNPLVYWPLGETNNKPSSSATAVAYDYAKGHNALVGNTATIGAAGPQGPQYNGFPSGHQALGCVQSVVGFGLPTAFGLSTANPTFTAWINTPSPGTAASWGIIFNRGNSASGGMNYNGQIGYTWNNNASATYNFASHLTPSANTWTFAACSIGSASTIVYMGGTNGILYTATNVNAATTSYSWTANGLMFIGEDSNSGTVGTYNTGRIFNGRIADAAVYNSALTPAQIQSLYNAAGIVPQFPALPASTNVNQGANLTETATGIGGSLPMTYTWYSVINGVSNLISTGTITSYSFTNATLSGNNVGAFAGTVSMTVTNLLATQSGTNYLQLQNQYGTTSSSTAVTVFAAPTLPNGLLPNNPTIFAGQNVTFTVNPNGAQPFHYQWSFNGSQVGVNTNFYTVSTGSLGLGSYPVSVVISNSVSNITAATTLTVVSGPTTAYPLQVLALNPVNYWRLNEADDNLGDNNDGQICHDYVGGLNGIYTNTSLGNLGYDSFDSSFPNFDGETSALFGTDSSSDSCAYNIPGVDFSAAHGTSAEFTVSAWVRGLGQSGTAPGIVGKGYFNNEEFTLDTGATGECYRFEMRDATGAGYNANSTLAASDATWHHLVGVCDQANSNIVLYIDGTNAGHATIAPGAGVYGTEAAAPLTIGARSSGGPTVTGYNQQFTGNMNDVAIFPYAMTVSQVQQLFVSAGIAPEITVQPLASTNIDQNASLTLSVTAIGTPALGYQWMDENNNAIPGATNATFTIADVTTNDYYTVVVTNGYGTNTSSQAAVNVLSSAPLVTTDITPLTLDVYAGYSLTFSVAVTGTLPFSYQWFENGTNILGATNSSYTFLIPLGTNTYKCGISNSQSGNTYTYSSTASITGAPTPVDASGLDILNYGPVAFWRLNEGPGTNTAYDFVGQFDGTYGTQTTNGQPGVPNPPFLGVPANDLGVWMDNTTASGSANGFITTPSLGLTVTNATITCWIYPNGSQLNSVGLVYQRVTGNANGINYGAGNAMVYTWANSANTYNWNSGLTIPTNAWSFLALVITPSNAVAYVFKTNGLAVNTNAVANPAVTLTSGFAIGADPQGSTLPARVFNGEMDDVAFFDYALSKTQLTQIYSDATTGGVVTPPTISIQLSGGNAVITWSAGNLFEASTVSGPWSIVSGATSPYTNTPSSTPQFYKAGIPIP